MKCEGQGDDAQPVASDADQDDRARLIGEIIAEWISSLGSDQAFTSGGVVEIAPGAERKGSGRNRDVAGC